MVELFEKLHQVVRVRRDHTVLRVAHVVVYALDLVQLLGLDFVQNGRAAVLAVGMPVAALQRLDTGLLLLVRVLLLCVVAKVSFVEQGVEDLFLPAVEFGAKALQLAALLVLADEVAGLPLLAHGVGVIVEQMGLAAKVLPVMRVNALRLVMLLVVGAPLSLEVKHVELLLPGHLVDERRFDVRVRVGEGAELFVLAGLGVLGAVLSLILGDVV